MPYFEKYFIKESFSCMTGISTLNGIKTMSKYMDKRTEHYTKDAYSLKMDIQSFFVNIDKDELFKMLGDFIFINYPNNRKKECLRWLFDILSPLKGWAFPLCYRKNKGLITVK